jgi:hypothetical protein
MSKRPSMDKLAAPSVHRRRGEMEEKEIIERDRVGNKEKDSKDGTNSLALVVHIKNPRKPHHNVRPTSRDMLWTQTPQYVDVTV